MKKTTRFWGGVLALLLFLSLSLHAAASPGEEQLSPSDGGTSAETAWILPYETVGAIPNLFTASLTQTEREDGSGFAVSIGLSTDAEALAAVSPPVPPEAGETEENPSPEGAETENPSSESTAHIPTLDAVTVELALSGDVDQLGANLPETIALGENRPVLTYSQDANSYTGTFPTGSLPSGQGTWELAFVADASAETEITLTLRLLYPKTDENHSEISAPAALGAPAYTSATLTLTPPQATSEPEPEPEGQPASTVTATPTTLSAPFPEEGVYVPESLAFTVVLTGLQPDAAVQISDTLTLPAGYGLSAEDIQVTIVDQESISELTITPAEGSDGTAPFYTLTFSSTADENGSLFYRVAVKALRPGETAGEQQLVYTPLAGIDAAEAAEGTTLTGEPASVVIHWTEDTPEPAPAIQLTQQLEPEDQTPVAKGSLTYRLTLTNTGDAALTNPSMTLLLPTAYLQKDGDGELYLSDIRIERPESMRAGELAASMEEDVQKITWTFQPAEPQTRSAGDAGLAPQQSITLRYTVTLQTQAVLDSLPKDGLVLHATASGDNLPETGSETATETPVTLPSGSDPDADPVFTASVTLDDGTTQTTATSEDATHSEALAPGASFSYILTLEAAEDGSYDRLALIDRLPADTVLTAAPTVQLGDPDARVSYTLLYTTDGTKISVEAADFAEDAKGWTEAAADAPPNWAEVTSIKLVLDGQSAGEGPLTVTLPVTLASEATGTCSNTFSYAVLPDADETVEFHTSKAVTLRVSELPAPAEGLTLRAVIERPDGTVLTDPQDSVTFQLAGPEDTARTLTLRADNDYTINITDLPTGEYTLREIRDGYGTSADALYKLTATMGDTPLITPDFAFTLDDQPAAVTLTLRRKPASLAVDIVRDGTVGYAVLYLCDAAGRVIDDAQWDELDWGSYRLYASVPRGQAVHLWERVTDGAIYDALGIDPSWNTLYVHPLTLPEREGASASLERRLTAELLASSRRTLVVSNSWSGGRSWWDPIFLLMPAGEDFDPDRALRLTQQGDFFYADNLRAGERYDLYEAAPAGFRPAGSGWSRAGYYLGRTLYRCRSIAIGRWGETEIRVTNMARGLSPSGIVSEQHWSWADPTESWASKPASSAASSASSRPASRPSSSGTTAGQPTSQPAASQTVSSSEVSSSASSQAAISSEAVPPSSSQPVGGSTAYPEPAEPAALSVFQLLDDLFGGPTPLGGFSRTDGWSLGSLLAVILMLILAVSSLVGVLRTPKTPNEDSLLPEDRRLVRILGILAALCGGIALLLWMLLEDFSQPRLFVNRWTLVILSCLILQLILRLAGSIRRRKAPVRRPRSAALGRTTIL